MDILLVAINAKYIHSNLAIRTLAAYANQYLCEKTLQKDVEETKRQISIDLAEYTINQQIDNILCDIYSRQPDVLCFSCYIWNIDYTERIIREIHKVLPHTDIWVGGPEVSYDAEKVLMRLPQATGVMRGEGEKTFARLCEIYEMMSSGESDMTDEMRCEIEDELGSINGITFRRRDGSITANPWRDPMDLDEIPFVYENMEEFGRKIIYYESSRGCPFSCSYCLSSVDKRLRFRSLDLVKKELQFFIDHKVLQVKFVDRTFNCRHEHATAIWRYIVEHDNGVTNFHFEVSADLFNEEELALIESMRPGLIQLEIGVQSTNLDTIRHIKRAMNFDVVRRNVERIKRSGNVHQHLDLIAGLPHEDIKSFARSFDEVYVLHPEQLQLGFLKVLKGSYMEENREEYGLVYKDTPPYEVLYTKWISYDDVLELKGVEEMVEVYYNSGQFTYTMEAFGREYESAYQMYQELWQYYDRHGYLEVQHKRSARYAILLEFVQERFPQKAEEIREFLTYDYYLRENAKTRPEFAGEYKVDKTFLREFYDREGTEYTYLPKYRSYDKNQMRKMTHIEKFEILKKIIIFDYMCRNPLNQEARTCMIKESYKSGKEDQNEF